MSWITHGDWEGPQVSDPSARPLVLRPPSRCACVSVAILLRAGPIHLPVLSTDVRLRCVCVTPGATSVTQASVEDISKWLSATAVEASSFRSPTLYCEHVLRQAVVLASELYAVHKCLVSSSARESPSPPPLDSDDDGVTAGNTAHTGHYSAAMDASGDRSGADDGDSGGVTSVGDGLVPARLVTAVAFDCLHRLSNANTVLSGISKLMLRWVWVSRCIRTLWC